MNNFINYSMKCFRLRVCKSRGHTFVLIPSSCSTPFLHGRAKLTVLKGSVSVLTYHLKPGIQYDVFSPTSGSLLSINCTDTRKVKAEEVRAELAKFGVEENDKDVSRWYTRLVYKIIHFYMRRLYHSFLCCFDLFLIQLQ